MCIYHLKEGFKMVDLKEFKIDVSVAPDITVNIRTRDPCDCLAISGAVVRTLRNMKLEPKAKVLP
jgi:hypothetical protein